MNVFVAVVPKKFSQLPAYEEVLKHAVSAILPFNNVENSKVVFTNGKILAASFSIHGSSCPIRDYVGIEDQKFCTFNGVPLYPFSNDISWGSALLQELSKGSLKIDMLGGYYNLIFINEGRIEAWNCLSRIEPVYWLENEDCIVVGNRASIVWALGNRSTDFVYDEMALMTMATAGWLVNDATPYQGVSVLPNGHKIIADNFKLSIEPYKPYDFRQFDLNNDLEEIAGLIHDEIVAGIRFFSKFKEKISVNLSGGKDSRILAAACAKAEIPFTCITSGGDLDPDMIVAKEVVQILDQQEHITSQRLSGDAIPQVDIFQMVKHHIKVGDGMLSINDPTYEIRKNPGFILTGHGGELLRGGYDRSLARQAVTGKEMALKFLKDLSLHNDLYFLKQEAVQYQMELNQKIFEKFTNSGFPTENLYDWVYTVYREGRGIGTIRQASSFGAFSFSPFLNDNLLKSAWRLPLSVRKEEYLYFTLLKRLHPELAFHRFADSRWKFEFDKPLPGSSLADWEKRAPLPPGPPSQGSHHWRLGFDGYLRPILRDYLLQNPNNKIFSFVDYRKLEKVLNAEPPTNSSVITSVFGIFTAAYLFSNDWK
jgi:hypothetical protein